MSREHLDADNHAWRKANVTQQHALVQLQGRHVHLHVGRHYVPWAGAPNLAANQVQIAATLYARACFRAQELRPSNTRVRTDFTPHNKTVCEAAR